MDHFNRGLFKILLLHVPMILLHTCATIYFTLRMLIYKCRLCEPKLNNTLTRRLISNLVPCCWFPLHYFEQVSLLTILFVHFLWLLFPNIIGLLEAKSKTEFSWHKHRRKESLIPSCGNSTSGNLSTTLRHLLQSSI